MYVLKRLDANLPYFHDPFGMYDENLAIIFNKISFTKQITFEFRLKRDKFMHINYSCCIFYANILLLFTQKLQNLLCQHVY